jgi:hypothetical protein
MALKGPISFSLRRCQQLSTPNLRLIASNALAATSTQQLLHLAKTIPLAVISKEPKPSILRRPMPSAMIVKTKLLTTSPSSVSVMKSPIFSSELPKYDRYGARLSVGLP